MAIKTLGYALKLGSVLLAET